MKYDTWVTVRELVPPLGENKFYAIANIHEIGKGPVDHDLGEVWGKTWAEAENKMRGKIAKWLEQMSAKHS